MAEIYRSVEALVSSLTREDLKNYHVGLQAPLRPIGTQFWVLYDARVPSQTSSSDSYNAYRYKVIGYDRFATFSQFSYNWWTLGERIDMHFEEDGNARSHKFPVTTYKCDDRGWYTDYPPEWADLVAENEATMETAMSGADVLQLLVDHAWKIGLLPNPAPHEKPA